jgi:hypothetical protein
MKKLLFAFTFSVLIVSCASKPTTSSEQVKKELTTKWQDRVGQSTKTDFVEEFGQAEWCEQEDTSEKCRFLRKKGTNWVGEKNEADKKRVDMFDQITATFDKDGILRAIDVKAQR